MNLKLLVPATAAALLLVSTASFGQSSTSARPEGSSGSNTGGVPPSMTGGSSSDRTGSAPSAASGASSAAARCAALSGPEKDRCLNDASAGTNGSDNTTKMRPEGNSGSNVGGVAPRMSGSSNGATTR